MLILASTLLPVSCSDESSDLIKNLIIGRKKKKMEKDHHFLLYQYNKIKEQQRVDRSDDYVTPVREPDEVVEYQTSLNTQHSSPNTPPPLPQEEFQLEMQMNQQQQRIQQQSRNIRQQLEATGFSLNNCYVNGQRYYPTGGDVSVSEISSSSHSRRSRSSSHGYTNSQLRRQADREAKAYEDYKRNPSVSSGNYYRSQRNMTRHMQEYQSR